MGAGQKGKRVSRDERRRQLLLSAVDAIREHGASASMEQLAAGGGVSKPILYRHFGDRAGLVSAIGSHFADRLLTRLIDSIGIGDTPEERVRATVESYLAFLEEDPELYSFLISQARTGQGGEAVNTLVETIGRQVSVVIRDRVKALGGDTGVAEPWGFGIVGMVHQAGDWWMSTKTMSRSALVDYLTALLWHGFDGLVTAEERSVQAMPHEEPIGDEIR